MRLKIRGNGDRLLVKKSKKISISLFRGYIFILIGLIPSFIFIYKNGLDYYKFSLIFMALLFGGFCSLINYKVLTLYDKTCKCEYKEIKENEQ